MNALYLFSVWLHIVAAIAWIGGMIFIAAVIVPTLREPAFRPHAAALVSRVGTRFRTIGWALIAVLVVTGTINMAEHGVGWTDVLGGAIWSGHFGRLLTVKLVLVGVVVLISVVHDFFVGPEASAAAQADPGSARSARLRRQASWMGRTNLLIALAIVALGVALARAFAL